MKPLGVSASFIEISEEGKGNIMTGSHGPELCVSSVEHLRVPPSPRKAKCTEAGVGKIPSEEEQGLVSEDCS